MISGIYGIKNTLNNKVYVGSTKNFEKRKKQHFIALRKNNHWNIKLQRAYNKYTETVFEFFLLEFIPYEKDLIVQAEDRWIKTLNSKKEGYNIADASFGDQLSNHPNRKEIIKKISKGLKKTFSAMSQEQRSDRFSKPGSLNPMYGKKQPQYVIDKIKQSAKKYILKNGHGPTKGIKLTQRTKDKISENAKLRTGNKNPFYGKKHSEQTKQKIAGKAIGRKCCTLHPIILDGVRYERLKDASEVTGIHITTLHYRAGSKNKKFINIYFEDSPKI
jgi:group I intron endonuclease